MVNHPPLTKRYLIVLFGRVIPNTVVKTYRGESLVARVERVFGFCYKELMFFVQKSSALRSQSAILGGPGGNKKVGKSNYKHGTYLRA